MKTLQEIEEQVGHPLTPETSVFNMGMDSLELVELYMSLKISLEIESSGEIQTVADLMREGK